VLLVERQPPSFEPGEIRQVIHQPDDVTNLSL
jgi:hypothetical protein